MTDTPDDRPPVVIATIPANLGPVQIAVVHLPYGVEVNVRPVGGGAWESLTSFGGTVELRAA